MSASGKDLRLRHLLHRETGTFILFAASHGTSTATIFHELDETADKVAAAIDGGADSVLISPPIGRLCSDIFRERPHAGFVAKVSATAFESFRQETPIWSAEAALVAGADGIGIMMQLIPENEGSVIRLIAEYGEECERLGLPYVVEAELPGAYQANDWMPEDPVRYLRRSCRLAEELGADIIKTNWPGSADGFASIVSAVTKPVIVAGGPRIQDHQLLEIIDLAMQAGAIGASVGRNIFQAPDPVQATANIAAIVHDRASVSSVLAEKVA
jgi:fructose-bisphosphate aldolase / 2-amino-3,7-dideoxy-D-threo-hept-6-ulosonate synthase